MSADRVTLDLSGIPVRALLEYLRGTGDQNISGGALDAVALQIEAQTKPPKPTEPTAAYAVVEDVDGNEWVRFDPGAFNWQLIGQPFAQSRYASWDDIPAVRVLSKGVTA